MFKYSRLPRQIQAIINFPDKNALRLRKDEIKAVAACSTEEFGAGWSKTDALATSLYWLEEGDFAQPHLWFELLVHIHRDIKASRA